MSHSSTASINPACAKKPKYPAERTIAVRGCDLLIPIQKTGIVPCAAGIGKHSDNRDNEGRIRLSTNFCLRLKLADDFFQSIELLLLVFDLPLLRFNLRLLLLNGIDEEDAQGSVIDADNLALAVGGNKIGRDFR